MVRRFDDRLVAALRELPLRAVLDGLRSEGVFWKVDPDFTPVKDARTVRLHVSRGGHVWELVVTGVKWCDAGGVGGGGAIDLVRHLLGLSFVDAVKMLERLGLHR